MNTSQFMDKQIMDLSNSQTNTTTTTTTSDFLDLINAPVAVDHHHHIGDSDRKEEILASYDFQPIRPVGSSSPPSKADSGGIGVPRAWNSSDHNPTDATGIRNYSSFEAISEPARVILHKDQSAVDPILVSEIDRTMKKYADNLMHALDSVSARISQLESRSHHLENSVDELKVSFGTNHGSSDGRIRQFENILREVQNGVQVIRDKQEILDTRLHIAKLQGEQHPADIESIEHVDSSQPAVSIGQQSHQQLPLVALTTPPPTVPPNAPPSPTHQQNLPPQVQFPSHFSHNQAPPVPPREPYVAPPPPPPPLPVQTPENLGQQYQLTPAQQLQPPSQAQSHPQHQYQPLPQLPFSQPPAPLQPHTSIRAVNPSQPQLHSPHHPEESPYVPSQSYPPPIRQNPLHSPSAAPPHQQFYGAPPPMYEPPSNRPGPVFSGTFGPSSGSGEQYPYSSSSSHYGNSPPVKPAGGYPHLPTARILPQAVPTASGVSSGPGSPGSGNRVPIDDVVDKVTNMGFSRDQVRATVRKLTENGQSVDLNAVLDKLMNDGEVQPPRGWFGR